MSPDEFLITVAAAVRKEGEAHYAWWFAQCTAQQQAIINASMAPRPKPNGSGRPSWRDHVMSAQALCDQKFPEFKFIVPGLFPEGVTLLVSRPKLGKSWLLQQVGSSVALGKSVLISPIEPEKPTCGDVLYLNLEDGNRKAQRRMTKYFGGLRSNWPARMTFASAWRRLDLGGVGDLREWCKSVEKPTLIGIDTLKRVRAPKRNGQSDYDADYESCQPLLDLGHEFPGLLFLVSHHDRKMDADDVFDTVSGTLGLTGGVDAIAILKRSGQGVTLHVEGRDLDEGVEKAIRFDRETCRWEILGEASEVHRSAERTRVLDVLCDGPAEGMTASEIKGAAGLRSLDDAVRQLLHRMAKAGDIDRLARGKYGLPLTPLSQASQSHIDEETPHNMGLSGKSDTCDTCDTPLGGGLQEHPGTAGQVSEVVSNPPDLGPPGDTLDDLDWGAKRPRPVATKERAPPPCDVCKGTGFRAVRGGIAPCPKCNPQVEEERP